MIDKSAREKIDDKGITNLDKTVDRFVSFLYKKTTNEKSKFCF